MKITKTTLNKLRKAYKDDPILQATERAVFKNGVLASAQNDSAIGRDDFVFSIDVDDEAVANQKQSGRCWMFAALNTLRIHIEKDLNLEKGTFELSQNYLFFYDKLEKANYFYSQIIDCADEPLDDRRVTFLMTMPQQDGGDWCQIAALIKKYGVMPRTAMGETNVSVASAEMDTVLNRKMREQALALRELVTKGADKAALDAARTEMLGDIYKIVAVCLGLPPEKFDFEYRDADGKYHGDFDLTPQDFLKKYVPIDVDDYIGIINLPTEPYGKLYGIEMSDEVEGGRPNRYINVDMETLKALTIAQLKAGEPVWFGCDVLQSSDRYKGIMDMDLYDLETLFGVKFGMNKTQRFQTFESLPTHAMVIGGVDIVDDKPRKWKVENSWGTQKGDEKVGFNGFFIMGDSWFDEYLYEVAIRKDLLPKEVVEVLDQDPIMLPYWNPFNPLP